MVISYPHIEEGDVGYAYAVGRIRAIETRLLVSQKIARLLDSTSADELLKALQDTDYSPYLPKTPSLYEEIIREARKELFHLMDELVLDPALIELLKVRYDYHNAKTLLKGSIGEKDVKDFLLDFGNIPTKEIIGIFQEERYDKLPYLLEGGIEEAVSSYYTSKDPRTIDISLDKACYKFLAQQTTNLFLNTLTKIEVDLINLKILLRIRKYEQEKALFSRSIIPRGYIKERDLLELFDEPLDGLSRSFEITPYYNIVDEGIDYLRSKDSFLKFEKLSDDNFISFVRTTKYMAFGVEPILSYFYAKENEFKILRMIFVGKLNGIPDSLIKERLPNAY
jgi:V/A-type H+-transporting ATPase subunit C